jgi:hypothetical protein
MRAQIKMKVVTSGLLTCPFDILRHTHYKQVKYVKEKVINKVTKASLGKIVKKSDIFTLLEERKMLDHFCN